MHLDERYKFHKLKADIYLITKGIVASLSSDEPIYKFFECDANSDELFKVVADVVDSIEILEKEFRESKETLDVEKEKNLEIKELVRNFMEYAAKGD